MRVPRVFNYATDRIARCRGLGPLPAPRPAPRRLRAALLGHDPTAEDLLKAIDDKLSWRQLQLDPAGYFIIRVDREAREIVADHYSNAINEKGLAVDDETGEVIGCRPGGAVRLPRRAFRGRTAKEISVRILEEPVKQQGGQEAGPGSGEAGRESSTRR